ncbi:MAG TPA: thioredoxin domain-containing protein [Acidimicrobiales bacterium]|nr:thioredoxin domain-containing protein [Acidimicrobiales bacterium]
MSGSVWVASYVLLWLAVLVLAVSVVALLRQIGVLHARLHPLGVHFAGEGPELDRPAPMAAEHRYGEAGATLLAFTAPTCEVCATLRPSLDALRRQYRELAMHVIDLDDTTRPTFSAFNVQSTPYVVAVDREGIVRGRGVANSLEQVEELLLEARQRAESAQGTDE